MKVLRNGIVFIQRRDVKYLSGLDRLLFARIVEKAILNCTHYTEEEFIPLTEQEGEFLEEFPELIDYDEYIVMDQEEIEEKSNAMQERLNELKSKSDAIKDNQNPHAKIDIDLENRHLINQYTSLKEVLALKTNGQTLDELLDFKEIAEKFSQIPKQINSSKSYDLRELIDFSTLPESEERKR